MGFNLKLQLLFFFIILSLAAVIPVTQDGTVTARTNKTRKSGSHNGTKKNHNGTHSKYGKSAKSTREGRNATVMGTMGV
jgi:hypothetical protein